MSAATKMAVLSCFLLIAFISEIFHQHVEAVSEADKNRVRLAYNAAFDTCKRAVNTSVNVGKPAADEECERAFKALDRIRQNTCRGWRRAGCRFIANERYPQCTCLISSVDDYAIKGNIVRPFRDCAATLWTYELSTGVVPAPTRKFQQLRSPYDEALKVAEARRTYSYFGRYGAAGSSSVYPSGGAGSSTGVDNRGGAGSSGGLYTSGYANPSAAYNYPQYAPAAPVSGGPIMRAPKTGPFVCGYCGKSYVHKNSLVDHQKSHNSLETYCILCELQLGSKNTYMSHMRKTHRNVFPDLRRRPANAAELEALTPFPCPRCPKRYTTKNSLRNHMKSHTTEDTKCRICGKMYSTRGNLVYHMETVHPDDPIPEPSAVLRGIPIIREPERGPFECGACGKIYVNKHSLVDHEKSHQSLDTYCFDCNTIFTSNSSYRAHMRRTHHEVPIPESAEGPEKCWQCGRGFKNARSLREHKAYHEGKTTCDECGIIFPRKSSLYSHKRKEHPQ